MNPPSEGANALQSAGKYTYADSKAWPETERWELIGGEAFAMSPAPTRLHQRIVSLLMTKLGAWFADKPCQPLVSPLDVFLPEGEEALNEVSTVVQPDLVVVCDEAKLIDEGVRGAPDLVIEVLSPSTAYRDFTDKRALYEKHGVREFWVVNPVTLEVTAWNLDHGSFGLPRPGLLRAGLEVLIFPGLTLRVTEKL
jgi:Uma2 family endonuclease